MTNYCQCGGKVALSTGAVYEVEPDQEPFDNGFIEEIEDGCGMGVSQYELKIDGQITFVTTSCVECGKVFSVDVQDECKEEYAKVIDRKNDVNAVEDEQK